MSEMMWTVNFARGKRTLHEEREWLNKKIDLQKCQIVIAWRRKDTGVLRMQIMGASPVLERAKAGS